MLVVAAETKVAVMLSPFSKLELENVPGNMGLGSPQYLEALSAVTKSVIAAFVMVSVPAVETTV